MGELIHVFFVDREQPIFTCKAHVFHIDPKTKRSWISASAAAVNVSFFYDSTRSLYRIISVEGTKVTMYIGIEIVSDLNNIKNECSGRKSRVELTVF